MEIITTAHIVCNWMGYRFVVALANQTLFQR